MELINFVNLTPHEITIKTYDKEFKIKPSGIIARVTTEEKEQGKLNNIPIVERSFGKVENLPEPKENVVYLVSSLVLEGVRDRDDVFAPDTGNTAIRDEKGRIIAVTRLIKAKE